MEDITNLEGIVKPTFCTTKHKSMINIDFTIIDIAAMNGQLALLKYMNDTLKWNLSVTNAEGCSSLHLAIMNNSILILLITNP